MTYGGYGGYVRFSFLTLKTGGGNDDAEVEAYQNGRSRIPRPPVAACKAGHSGRVRRRCPARTEEAYFRADSRWICQDLRVTVGEVAVIVPAKMTILKSGILITDVAIRTPWEDWPLDLWDPEETPYYKDLIGDLCHFLPTVLNPWLERDVPLRPRRQEGVIIAHGYIRVPPECHDETLVTVQLLLEDAGCNQLSFEFGVRVDRCVMRRCERQQRQLREFSRSVNGGDLFEPKGGRLRDPESVSRDKQPQAGGEHNATGDAGTPETTPANR